MRKKKPSLPIGATLGLAMLAALSAGLPRLGLADDTPPASTAPDNPGAGRHHNDPAWQACHKQAEDKGLAPGDARREFMKNCMKAAKPANPPAS